MNIDQIDANLTEAYRLARETADAIQEHYKPQDGSAEQDAFNHAGGGAGALDRARQAWRRAVREVKGEP